MPRRPYTSSSSSSSSSSPFNRESCSLLVPPLRNHHVDSARCEATLRNAERATRLPARALHPPAHTGLRGRSRHPAASGRILRCLQSRHRNPLSTSSPWEAAARYRSSSGSSGCACTPVRLTGSSAARAWLRRASTMTLPASSTRRSTPLCRSNSGCNPCVMAASLRLQAAFLSIQVRPPAAQQGGAPEV